MFFQNVFAKCECQVILKTFSGFAFWRGPLFRPGTKVACFQVWTEFRAIIESSSRTSQKSTENHLAVNYFLFIVETNENMITYGQK